MGKSTIPEVLRHSYLIVFQLTRPWTLTEYMFTLMPYFSLLAHARIVTAPTLVISLMVPLLLLFAAGYAFNSRYDVHVDTVDKNPITRGAISKGKASLIAIALLFGSIFSMLLVYTSIMALLLFIVHLFLGCSYNGLKLRFKESLVGVFIAGVGFYTIPSLYILIQFGYFSNTALSLLLFIFLIYTGREILHALFDYEKDAHKNCQTFAVRFGRTKAWVIMHILGSAGCLVILLESFSSGNPILQALSILFGAGYFTIMTIEILFYRLLHNLGFLWVVGKWPFFLSRLYLLLFSLMYLELSPLIILIVVWAFLTTKHY